MLGNSRRRDLQRNGELGRSWEFCCSGVTDRVEMGVSVGQENRKPEQCINIFHFSMSPAFCRSLLCTSTMFCMFVDCKGHSSQQVSAVLRSLHNLS